MTVIDRYFTQLDLAVEDEETLPELAGLFAQDASLRLKGYDEIRGREKIREFFRVFLGKNKEMKHVWNTVPEQGGFLISWAAACIGKTGGVFTLEGTDHAVLDDDGNILRLTLGIGNHT